MKKRFRRMSSSEIDAITRDLDLWATGQLGSKLTWAVLEERSGFSRQSLQAKAKIKAAYDLAKRALSGGLVQSRKQASEEYDELMREVERLKLEIARYKKREGLWRMRWQRIAYHVRARGVQMSSVDMAISSQDELLSIREAQNILRPLAEEIPPSGRV